MSSTLIDEITKTVYTQDCVKYTLYIPNVTEEEHSILTACRHRFVKEAKDFYYSKSWYNALPICNDLCRLLNRDNFVLARVEAGNFLQDILH